MNNTPNIKKNIIYAFLGKVAPAAMAFFFTPIYIQILGIEAYGLIGLFTTIMVLSAVFDFGLSQSLTKKLSTVCVGLAAEKNECRNFLRTAEWVYWSIALGLALLLAYLAPLITTNWLGNSTIPQTDITTTIRWMGIALMFQWPFTLYYNGLVGLQKLMSLNLIIIITSIFRYGGVIFALLFSPEIATFFIYQGIAGLLQTVFLAIMLWYYLPPGTTPKFQISVLKNTWRFALGLTGGAILTIILVQLDKIIISHLMPLEFFGYYTLAFTLANLLSFIYSSFFNVFFPRFSQLVAQQQFSDVCDCYHSSCQWLTIILVPIAIVTCYFSTDLLSLWLQDENIISHVSPILSLLIIGNLFHGLIFLPYAMQLAHGWTSLAFYQNLISVIILSPLLFMGIKMYQLEGAAFTWILLTLGYVFILPFFMHKKILLHEIKKWYIQDISRPILAALLIPTIVWFYWDPSMHSMIKYSWIAVSWFCSFLLALCSVQAGRDFIKKCILKFTVKITKIREL